MNDVTGDSYQDAAEQREAHDRYFGGQDAAESVEERDDIPPDIKRPRPPKPTALYRRDAGGAGEGGAGVPRLRGPGETDQIATGPPRQGNIAKAPRSPSVPDPTLHERRKWHAYHQAGLPWTAEFEDAVNEGLVDVS